MTRYEQLQHEIYNGPLAAELADMAIANDDNGIVAVLNDETRGTLIKERLCTAGTILSKLGPEIGANVLDKLETAAASLPAVKWAMRLIMTTGIDVGDPSTRAQLDALAQAGVLTESEAEAIKAIAVFPASRGEIIGLGQISWADVSHALRGPW